MGKQDPEAGSWKSVFSGWQEVPGSFQVLCSTQIGHQTRRGFFSIGGMRLSGILPASARILLPATPRRSPLRLRLGEKHHDTSGQSPRSLMTDLGSMGGFAAGRSGIFLFMAGARGWVGKRCAEGRGLPASRWAGHYPAERRLTGLDPEPHFLR